MKCPNCGCFGEGKYCSNCATELPIEEIRAVESELHVKSDSPLKGIIIAVVIVLIFAWLNNSNTDTSTTSLSTTNNENGKAHEQIVEEQAKKLYDSGLEFIASKKYIEAFKKLKGISNSSTYYSKAQAKIDEILKPLAQERLDLAKKFFNEKNYRLAYTQIKEAYGTIKPPLPEAKKLLPLYEKKKNQQEEEERKEQERQSKELARQEREAAKSRMETYEAGYGNIQIAVSAKTTRSVSTDYGGGWTAKKDGQFVWVDISALNKGDTSEHVNPNDFTLSTPDGYTANPDTEATYSRSNYFDAIDLTPNTYSSGWLIFYMPKKDRYILHYKGFHSEVDKDIVL